MLVEQKVNFRLACVCSFGHYTMLVTCDERRDNHFNYFHNAQVYLKVYSLNHLLHLTNLPLVTMTFARSEPIHFGFRFDSTKRKDKAASVSKPLPKRGFFPGNLLYIPSKDNIDNRAIVPDDSISQVQKRPNMTHQYHDRTPLLRRPSRPSKLCAGTITIYDDVSEMSQRPRARPGPYSQIKAGTITICIGKDNESVPTRSRSSYQSAIADTLESQPPSSQR